jgi:acyl-CoA synthetase (AMP-forming)/AMP-acid ligase II
MSHFDMEDFCKFVEQYKITTTAVAPPVCLALARHPAVSKYNMKTLKYVISGAAPLPAPVVIATRDKLRSVGAEIFLFQGPFIITPLAFIRTKLIMSAGYGLTETVGTVSCLPHENYMTKVGSVGLLAPNWELRLVIDGERDAEEGERGEMWIRGPAIMKVRYLFNFLSSQFLKLHHSRGT